MNVNFNFIISKKNNIFVQSNSLQCFFTYFEWQIFAHHFLQKPIIRLNISEDELLDYRGGGGWEPEKAAIVENS